MLSAFEIFLHFFWILENSVKVQNKSVTLVLDVSKADIRVQKYIVYLFFERSFFCPPIDNSIKMTKKYVYRPNHFLH